MPRHVTDHDKAPLIEVLTLMFMVIAILACFVRSGTKLYMIKTLKTDDILTVVATVCNQLPHAHSLDAVYRCTPANPFPTALL